MNHGVVTHRWKCPECGDPLRLEFSPGGFDEDGHAHEIGLDDASCAAGHQIPDDLSNQIMAAAVDEFFRAQKDGIKIYEVVEVFWKEEKG